MYDPLRELQKEGLSGVVSSLECVLDVLQSLAQSDGRRHDVVRHRIEGRPGPVTRRVNATPFLSFDSTACRVRGQVTRWKGVPQDTSNELSESK